MSTPSTSDLSKQETSARGTRHFSEAAAADSTTGDTGEVPMQQKPFMETASAPPEQVLFELRTRSALKMMNFLGDQEGKDRVLQLYVTGMATNTREGAAEEMRRLARAAVERRRVEWGGVTPLLRKLANMHWELTPDGRPRIRELEELLRKARANAQGGSNKS